LTENAPSPASTADSTSWIPAARLLRPQGRRGELLAELLSDLPGLFAPGRRVSLAASGTVPATETTLESHWTPTGRNAGRIVVKLAGVDTISAAELLAGWELLVPATDLPALGADTWFVRDLIGCQLFDGATLIGEITGVEYPMSADGRTRLPDAAPLLEVTIINDAQRNLAIAASSPHTELEPQLIPFVKAWLLSVDLDAKRVVMNLPAGLLDLREE
jgi:16S rRNA processing protein RimM